MDLNIIIRDAKLNDVEALAFLATQLGYPCIGSEIAERIDPYLDNPEARIIVAARNGTVVGWLSLNTIKHFYTKPFIEISGLVVDERERRKGIGKALIEAAEKWTREKGYKVLRLKTNVKRKEAHRFYENNGFNKVKEQYVYVKELKS